MATDTDDYVLGTDEHELTRLGQQHAHWRPVVLDCWRRAGVGPGMTVLDLGAGPGFASVDLAQLVGPQGTVLAVERSSRYVATLRERCAELGLAQVEVRQQDLMRDDLGQGIADAAWIRWVACFVASPERLVSQLHRALRPKGRVIFHEYLNYECWRAAPRSEPLEGFVSEVMASWRDSGGEPNAAEQLPSLLVNQGFAVRSVRPHLFCVGPQDPLWQWPASFIEVNLTRLVALGRVTAEWAETVRRAWATLSEQPVSLVTTPLVLEIVADRLP